MLIFTIFGNELLEQIQSFGAKVKICDECVNCAAFADDITLIAKCKTDLQSLFDTAHNYSRKWRFQYNPAKCAVMIFGIDSQPRTNILLGTDTVQISPSEPHLGNVLATSKHTTTEFIKERIKKCKTVCYAIQSLGSRKVPVNPIVASKLYKSVCITKLCYGTEVMELNDECYEAIEQFHAQSAKLFQGLPQHTSNVGSVGTIGWESIKVHIDMLRIMFMWRILLLPVHNLYKTIMIRRFVDCVIRGTGRGPVWTMITACHKYNIFDIVYDSLLSGNYMSVGQFKKMVTGICCSKDIQSWKITCQLYTSIRMYNTQHMTCKQRLSWWNIAYEFPECTYKCRMIIRLLLNVFRLGKEMCHLCCQYKRNSVNHIIFECDFVKDIRTEYWDIVRESCPRPLYEDMLNMTSDKRCAFILSGFNGPFICEWYELYQNMMDFVYKVYMTYHNGVKDVQ